MSCPNVLFRVVAAWRLGARDLRLLGGDLEDWVGERDLVSLEWSDGG